MTTPDLEKLAEEIVAKIDEANDRAHGIATNWCPTDAKEIILTALSDLIARVAEAEKALEDIANIQPLWNGGVRPHKAEQWAALVGEIKDLARAALTVGDRDRER
jgi:hypothetical protein